jgi:A118 family predicted phage portal protein
MFTWLNSLLLWIKKRFGQIDVTNAQINTNRSFTLSYSDLSTLNITGIIAKKLAQLIVSDNTIDYNGDSPKALKIHLVVEQIKAHLQTIVTRCLAVGGVVIKPAYVGGEFFIDILNQDRFIDVKRIGPNINSAAFLMDEIAIDDRVYQRIETHNLENGVYTITQTCMLNGNAVPMIETWKDFRPETTLTGVERMLFTVLKSPVDTREDVNSPYGAPITYGCESLIKSILDTIEEMNVDITSKRSMLGIDQTCFTGVGQLPRNGIISLFNAIDANGMPLVIDYSPDIRIDQYRAALEVQLQLLEKACGLSRGILTDMDTRNATATEIKRSLHDTFSAVDSIRDGIHTAINEILYACEVICDVNGIAGEPGELSIEWSYSLLEDTTETRETLFNGYQVGVVEPWELRRWIFDETENEAKAGLPDMEAHEDDRE